MRGKIRVGATRKRVEGFGGSADSRSRCVEDEAMVARKTISVSDVLQMSVPERIELVEDIWDSIAADPQAIPITASQKAELDRRLRAMKKDPGAGIPWEVAKRKIRGG
jgi:putative addiction module component (TIGR02574 family)